MAGSAPVINSQAVTSWQSADAGDPVAGGLLHWQVETPLPAVLEIGRGLSWAWRGYCFHDQRRIRDIVVCIGSERRRLRRIAEPREDVARRHLATDRTGHSLLSGFWDSIPFVRDYAGSHAELAMELHLDGGASVTLPLGRTSFVAQQPCQAWNGDARMTGSTVAVCMATYEPDPAGFRRQIDSLLAQDYTDWIGIINDDGSGSAALAMIERECARDPRLRLFRNEHNLGFYRNFEATLRRVPEQCGYVALADQDDDWFPDKLSTLVTALPQHADLVYSDMRLVSPDGRVIANSYWTRRRNNFRDLRVVLLANTVTGAASLFRRTLLDTVLPFPQRVGDAFHDHWIACSALAGRGLAYVDRPLYDYIQHDASVIGHCDFGPRTVGDRLRGLGVALAAVITPHRAKTNLLRLRNSLVAVYAQEYRRIRLFQETIGLRQKVTDRRKRAALALFNDTFFSVLRLLTLNPLLALRGDTTDDAELRLAGGWLMDRLNRRLMGWFPATVLGKMRKDPPRA